MEDGYITIHRRILTHPLWKNLSVRVVFIQLLFMACYKETRFFWNDKEHFLKRGQLLTGRKKLAEACGVDESTIYKNIKMLESMNVISVISNNRFSIITIIKYNDYQLLPNQNNSKVTTKEQQNNNKVTHTNKYNKENKSNKDTNVSKGRALANIKPDVQLVYKYGLQKGFEERLYQKNRWAINRLLLKMTVEQIKELVDLSIEVQPLKFAPAINSFIDLEYKLLNLKTFVQREGNKQSRMA